MTITYLFTESRVPVKQPRSWQSSTPLACYSLSTSVYCMFWKNPGNRSSARTLWPPPLRLLSGGRNFGQKAQKGREKRWPEAFVTEFMPNFTKSGRKGADENFPIKVLILQWWQTLGDKDKIELSFIIDTSDECCIDAFFRIGQTFVQNWEHLFTVLAVKKYRDLATMPPHNMSLRKGRRETDHSVQQV